MGCTRSFDAGLLTATTDLALDWVASATEDLLLTPRVLTAMVATELGCKEADLWLWVEQKGQYGEYQ